MLIGCGAPPSVLLLPETNAASVVVVFDGDEVTAQARDLPLGSALEYDSMNPAQITLLFYDVDLERLRLPSGALRLEPEGAPLPAPDQIFATDVSPEADVSPFEKQMDLPPRVAGLRTPRLQYGECPEFAANVVLVADGRAILLLQLDEEVALVSDDRDTHYIVTPEEVRTLDQPELDGYLSGWSSPDGRFFVAGRDEKLAELTYHGGFEITLRPLIDPKIGGRWITQFDGVFENGEFELFATTPTGGLGRYTSTSTAWAFLPRAASSFTWDRQIARVGPGEAIAVDGGNRVLRVRRSEVSEELNSPGLEFKSVLQHSEHGEIASASDGFAHLFFGPVWEAFQSGVTIGAINRMAEAPDGEILWGSSNGFVGMVVDQERKCEATRWENDSIERLHLIGDSRTAVVATQAPLWVEFLSW